MFRFSGNTSWSCTSEDSRESHPGPLMPVPTLWSITYHHAKHIWGSFPLFRCYWFTASAFLLGLLPTSLYWRAGTWERATVPHNGMPGLTPNLLPISLVSMSLLLDAAQMLTPILPGYFSRSFIEQMSVWKFLFYQHFFWAKQWLCFHSWNQREKPKSSREH